MTDATPSTAPDRRSSILYAMGRLEAVVASQADTIKELPARVLEVIAPQLLEVNRIMTDHEGRIRHVERTQWLIIGGGVLATTLIGWLAELKR